MDEPVSSSRSHSSWLCGLAKLWRRLAGHPRSRRRPAIDAADDKLRRDIGLGGDAGQSIDDVRAAFYRKLLERGQPWP